MHSRASDEKASDLEEDWESIKRKMKNLAKGENSFHITGRDNITDDEIGTFNQVHVTNQIGHETSAINLKSRVN